MNSQSEIAYQKLLERIRNQELTSGTRIMEVELAKQMGLSRTPVREAIRRLEAEGLIDHQPRIGATIKKLSHQEIVEIYEMRLVLEEAAAAMAAQHASPAEIEIMRNLNQALSQSKDPIDAARINADLHRRIYLAARNQYLLRIFDELSNVLILLGSTTISDEARLEEVFTQHEALIDAIDAKDQERARSLAHTHLATSMSARLSKAQ